MVQRKIHDILKMISRREYILRDVRMAYDRPLCKAWFLDRILRTEQYYIKRYMSFLRSEEYYTFVKHNKALRFFYFRKKNALGARLGFFIPAGCFGPDLKIAHYGSIIVNPHSKIGTGCTLHGNCCIGNKGTDSYGNDSPVIGDNANIGQGAQVIGPIKLAKDITVAAGAIVTKSFDEEGLTLVGAPAIPMKK